MYLILAYPKVTVLHNLAYDQNQDSPCSLLAVILYFSREGVFCSQEMVTVMSMFNPGFPLGMIQSFPESVTWTSKRVVFGRTTTTYS